MITDLQSETPKDPVTPIPAATVISLRDTPTGMEVLMVQRTKKADFAGGALLFPGGKVDNSDYEVLKLDRCSLPNDVPDNQKALRVAGVREMFEEAGLLFVRDLGDTQVISKERAEVLKNIYRQDLLSQKITFHEIVEAEDLVVASDLLIPFAHWITPITGRKRFDTHFLVAQSPDGHIASHDGSETLDTVWIDPLTAITEAEEGKRRVVFPTRMNLKKVSESTTAESAIRLAKITPVVTVLPEVHDVDGGRHLKIPIEAGYGISEITVDYAASDQPPPTKPNSPQKER
ncbi:NUDIX hydrolase [Alphaproteobacteria bacterium]|nr:NUDIX hydrolase [Alphaproteobacteria bacterium]|tara:strand:- start:1216 stop:2082 length:867 start_codon:yes stop_codon:yes gene_type:complete